MEEILYRAYTEVEAYFACSPTESKDEISVRAIRALQAEVDNSHPIDISKATSFDKVDSSWRHGIYYGQNPSNRTVKRYFELSNEKERAEYELFVQLYDKFGRPEPHEVPSRWSTVSKVIQSTQEVNK